MANAIADALSKVMEVATESAKEILVSIGTTLIDVTERTKELADVVVPVRLAIEREVKSKVSGKTVTVKDLDGRSKSYRTWYNQSFMPLVDEYIPKQYKSGVLQALQTHVQAAIKAQAKPSELKHLGLSGTTKEQNRADKAKDAGTSKNEVAPLGDQIASEDNARVGTMVEVASVIARFAALLDERYQAEGENLAAGDRNTILAMVNTAGVHLANVGTAAAEHTAHVGEKEKTPAQEPVAA